MSAQGTPTPRLRLIRRGGDGIIQQLVYVTFDVGQTKERSRWVWLDLSVGVETEDEKKARLEVEGIKDFVLATYQFVR
jgi:hypothetical protein